GCTVIRTISSRNFDRPRRSVPSASYLNPCFLGVTSLLKRGGVHELFALLLVDSGVVFCNLDFEQQRICTITGAGRWPATSGRRHVVRAAKRRAAARNGADAHERQSDDDASGTRRVRDLVAAGRNADVRRLSTRRIVD